MPSANGTFDITGWEPETYDEREGATLSRVHVTKTFHGDLEGTSTTDILTAMTQVEGSAAYVGLERFTGSLHGRKGTLVLQHSATGSRGEQTLSWTIVPDSGTGELLEVRGGGRITAENGTHTYTLDYDLP
ncbi:hypothetical protein Sme01_42240 [Sphaerisporangium melleum]|uniref:DUF3224 domain-containing protein n=1 Tax=Sphaerisporangium melleum TaxID=321316 RepID=A0A917VSW3_9ACTN|nr:DUF3224 domain-containing protein [Sphaerisporangium melleum]GGL11286.1 hypothetical protein GCM10007964_61790 [Sphaerisporangium melleum]GII71748.1 hypothetical protein Sme01_42240 [Sphaerisporangium melleum]